ncbi:uncharacterized protein LOC142582140 [Dermacentor variabilis]|uniref:uncharacterized protein LOC142582140 n=1 Tax=Dermacentor variabilis TaxID=34621 RepID=UPI003F5C99E2
MNETFTGVLRACLTEMRPLIGYRRDPDGTVVATGLGGYVYYLLVESLMIKHVVLVPKEQIYAGTFPNGSWAGCLGKISRNEADLAIGPILPTISRFTVAQPLPQYYFIHLALCGGTKRLFKTDVFAYVTALDSQARLLRNCFDCARKTPEPFFILFFYMSSICSMCA